MKLKDGIDLYIGSKDYAILAPKSKATYAAPIRRLALLGDMDIETITKADIEKIRSDLTYGSDFMFCAVTKKIWSFFIQNDLATKTVVRPLSRTSISHQPWTDEEIRRFIDVSPEYVSRPVRIALLTGQRITSVLNLSSSDYDGQFVKFPPLKRGAPVYINVGPELEAILRGRTGPVCQDAHGKPYTYDRYHRVFKTFKNSIGVDKTIHGIRVTHAIDLAENGATSKEIQHRLGHKTIFMAELYTKEADRKMTAINLERKMDGHFDRKTSRNRG